MEENIYTEVSQRLARIEEKLNNIENMKKDVDEVRLEINTVKGEVNLLKAKDEIKDKELKELKDSNKWLIRAIIIEVIGIVSAATVAILSSGLMG